MGEQKVERLRADITVGEVMTSAPYSVKASEPVFVAQDLMSEKKIRHIPVLDHGKVIGIVSDRDLRFATYFEKRNAANLSVADICHHEPYTVTPETKLSEVLLEMKSRLFGSVLVAKEGELLGIFTTTDALRFLIQALGQL